MVVRAPEHAEQRVRLGVEMDGVIRDASVVQQRD
jgi:hypothetical protein